ncbi:unnamed protein product [Ectocarpus sp. CCAP 1310/34]|nr:unnamed protein product [Ectocarpus sp. CCAP 1310/34]
MELNKRLAEKKKRRELREAESRRRKEKRARDEEAKALRKRMGSSVKEADRLRAKLRDRAEQTGRVRAREALWRWRAHAAGAVATRERRERLAAEQAMAASSTTAAALAAAAAAARGGGAVVTENGDARNARRSDLARNNRGDDEAARRRDNGKGRAVGAAATLLAPSGDYQGVYGGGSSSGGGGMGGNTAGCGEGQLGSRTPIERRGRGAHPHDIVGATPIFDRVSAAAAAGAAATGAGADGSSTSAALATSVEAPALRQDAAHQAAAAAALERDQRERARGRAPAMEVGTTSGQVTDMRRERQERSGRRVWLDSPPTAVTGASAPPVGAVAPSPEATERRAGRLQAAAGMRASMGSATAAKGAAATTAATAAATATAEADDAARRSWEAQEQELQLSRLSAERSQLEGRMQGAAQAATAAAAAAAAVERDFQLQRQEQQQQLQQQQERQRAWWRQQRLHKQSQQDHLEERQRQQQQEEEEQQQQQISHHQRPQERQQRQQQHRRWQHRAWNGAVAGSGGRDEEAADDDEEEERGEHSNDGDPATRTRTPLAPVPRARDERRVRSAFGAWRSAATSAARERRSARQAARRGASSAAVAAGARAAAGVVVHAEKRAVRRSFRLWMRAAEYARRKDLARQAALRQATSRAAQRCRQLKVSAFQRWRLATAAAAVERLRRRERAGSIGRGAVVAEAVLRRRDAGRVLSGFRRWREADEEAIVAAGQARDRRATAAAATAALLHRRRRSLLRQGLQALGAAARAAVERRLRAERASLSAAMSKRASRTLVLTRCWDAWKAAATAGGLARRLAAAGAQAQRMAAERRHLRAEQLAWVCKAALAASDVRRKARAWRLWRQVQGRADTEHALVNRILLAAAQRWRTGRLRAGVRRWRIASDAVRSERELVRLRAAKLGSVSAFLGGGSGSLRRTPRMDVARAFGTWVRVAEGRKVESLKSRQGARILLGVLRFSRRNALARAVGTWRSAAERIARVGRCVHNLALRTAHRQRLFLLGKAWARIAWAAGEREAARARQRGAARVFHSLVASSARTSRCRAWTRWRTAVAENAVAGRLRGAQRRALRRCVRSRLLRDTGAAWGEMRRNFLRSRALVSGAARLDWFLVRARRRAVSRRLGSWRTAVLAGAIDERRRESVRGRRHAAARLLGSAAARVKRRRLEGGWRALATFAERARRAEGEASARSKHADRLARAAAERSRRRVLARAWRAWSEVLAQRRLQGAVGAATSSLEEETASLARQVQLLRLSGTVRVIFSAAERSNRVLLQRGWRGLREASQRRAVLLRVVGISSRARSRRLILALNRWRLATNDARTARLRAGAGRSVLAACLAGARGRAMRPAWESWCELVTRERGEEDDFAGREEGLLAFASVISRVGRRRDRDRRLRAFEQWRLGAARTAATVARQQATRGDEVVRAVEVENALTSPSAKRREIFGESHEGCAASC